MLQLGAFETSFVWPNAFNDGSAQTYSSSRCSQPTRVNPPRLPYRRCPASRATWRRRALIGKDGWVRRLDAAGVGRTSIAVASGGQLSLAVTNSAPQSCPHRTGELTVRLFVAKYGRGDPADAFGIGDCVDLDDLAAAHGESHH